MTQSSAANNLNSSIATSVNGSDTMTKRNIQMRHNSLFESWNEAFEQGRNNRTLTAGRHNRHISAHQVFQTSDIQHQKQERHIFSSSTAHRIG